MNFKDEIQGDLVNALAQDVLPKFKQVLPFLKGKIEQSDDLLKENELILIGKNSKNEVVFLKFDKEVCNPLAELSQKKDKIEVFSLDNLIDKFMDL